MFLKNGSINFFFGYIRNIISYPDSQILNVYMSIPDTQLPKWIPLIFRDYFARNLSFGGEISA